MSDCCGGDTCGEKKTPEDSGLPLCPECGKKGKKVERVTLMALLTPQARGRLTDDAWRFCGTGGCDVVYFSGERILRQEDVNVRVGQKETDPSRYVCYCFNHTVQSIRDEFEKTGKTTVVESITEKIKAKKCACEYTNPQGTCCLRNVRAAVKEVISGKYSTNGRERKKAS